MIHMTICFLERSFNLFTFLFHQKHVETNIIARQWQGTCSSLQRWHLGKFSLFQHCCPRACHYFRSEWSWTQLTIYSHHQFWVLSNILAVFKNSNICSQRIKICHPWRYKSSEALPCQQVTNSLCYLLFFQDLCPSECCCDHQNNATARTAMRSSPGLSIASNPQPL